MSLKKILRKYLPRLSANTVAVFERNDLAQAVYKKRNFIQTLDYHIVEHYNLNCKCCSTYAPLAKEEFTDIEVFTSVLKQLKQVIGDRMLSLHLLGGEPLLHLDIDKLIIAERTVFPKIYIDVITNELLVRKMPDSIWEALQEQNVLLRFSAYPINMDYSELVNYTKSKSARSFSFKETEHNDVLVWKPLDIFVQQNIYSSHMQCSSGNTTQLRKGKLYRHPATAYVYNLNRKIKEDDPSALDESLKIHELDYIDIYKVKDKLVIFDFLSNAILSAATVP